jgi:hypothetical protein
MARHIMPGHRGGVAHNAKLHTGMMRDAAALSSPFVESVMPKRKSGRKPIDSGRIIRARYLVLYEGRTHAEAAEATGVSRSTVTQCLNPKRFPRFADIPWPARIDESGAHSPQAASQLSRSPAPGSSLEPD